MLRAVKQLLGPSIAYRPVLAKAFNSSTTAIFISQCIYWSDKTSEEDLSFYKSRDEWHYETGLSEKQVEMAAKKAKDKGVLETNYVRNEHKNYFTLNMGALLKLVGAYLEAHPQKCGGTRQKGGRQPTKGGFDIHKTTHKTTHKKGADAPNTGADLIRAYMEKQVEDGLVSDIKKAIRPNEKERGMLKTLAEKGVTGPELKKLIGVNWGEKKFDIAYIARDLVSLRAKIADEKPKRFSGAREFVHWKCSECGQSTESRHAKECSHCKSRALIMVAEKVEA